jgi:hypothetical protein
MYCVIDCNQNTTFGFKWMSLFKKLFQGLFNKIVNFRK